MIHSDDKILIIAAHPDDEVLGCGGTVRKVANRFGNQVQINALLLSEGLTSRANAARTFSDNDLGALKEDALSAAKLLGIQKVFFGELPNNRLDSMDLLDVIHIIERHLAALQPTVVFTHHHGDINIAHRITFQAVLTACRPLPGCSVRKLYSFEIPSSTEWAFPNYKSAFSPNTFVDVEKEIDIKISAMQAYRSESREKPHPRSPEILKAIALRWGSVANIPSAEAFELIYDINNVI